MKKLMIVIIALLSMSFVSAWHCIDVSDQDYSYDFKGWLENPQIIPDGCYETGNWWNPVKCTNGQIDDCTYREFYCGPRLEPNQNENVIWWEDRNTCNEVPEFGSTLGVGLMLLGSGAFMLRKRK